MSEPSPEMIERVARALCRLQCLRNCQGETPDEAFIQRAVDCSWGRWTDDARAAIEAMAEPTPAMAHAGRWPAEDDGPAACWTAMIDAALAAPET